MKPRRTAPAKRTRPEPERQRISNRARRREALRETKASGRLPIYPDPEPSGEYRP